MQVRIRYLAIAVALAVAAPAVAIAAPQSTDVTRATLGNGLRVIIVQDSLAPVATMQLNYLAGSDEAPTGFPGMAHAMEHMMFQGSPGLTKNQLLAIAANMGGAYNAATTRGVTQYHFTVPAKDLGVALRVAAIRMRGVDVTEKAWQKERGAIEQEVSRDHSNPAFKLQTQLFAHMFAGTPYAHTPLGTRASFNKTTATMLKKFHQAWYAPNNAVLVIAGDIDPAAALKQVTALFGDIPRRHLPAKPSFAFKPMQATSVKLPTDSPVGTVALAWRMPGLRDKDYATALVLSQAMASKRGKLFALGLTGKALAGGFGTSFLPHAGVAFAVGVFRRGADTAALTKTLRGIIAQTAAKGVPAELVKAAKSQAIASLEYKKNSVSGLASSWSHAIAFRDGASPDDVRAQIAAVTPAEVDALARRVFKPAHALTAVLAPESSGKPVSRKGFGGSESFGGEPSGPVTLPTWAAAAFAKLTVPELDTHPTSFKLANGLRVIVQPESVSKTVEVVGVIKSNADMQVPKGKKGVAGVMNTMFNFGTAKLNRLKFQAALDAISAHVTAGTNFSLTVPSANFAQGMQLLAANELHPALSPMVFMVMQRRAAGAQAGVIKSPGFMHSMHLSRALYPANYPGLRYATPKSIKGLTMADVKAYMGNVFRPDMTTIVVIGDVTPAQARKVVEANFGAWKATGPKPETDYPAVAPNKASHFHTPDSSAVQDAVTLAETIKLTQTSPDRFALVLGNQILGGGFHSHLMRDLRSQQGLVYGVSSSLNTGKHGGTFTITYGSDPDKASKARALAVRDVKQMLATPVTAAELHAAKGKMLRQLTLSRSSFGAIAGNLLGLALEGKPLDAATTAAHAYHAMTAAQIQTAFKKYIRPDAFVTAIKGPAAK